MRPVAKGDLAGGLLSVAFGSAVLVHVRTFPQLPGGQPGPALFPGIIGALMIVFGLVLSVRSFGPGKNAAAEPSVPATDPAPAATAGDGGEDTDQAAAPKARTNRAGLVNAAAIVGAVIAYILVADVIGFVPTMVVLLGLLMWRLGTRPLTAIGAAVITTAFITVVFRLVLLVPLPQGPLGI